MVRWKSHRKPLKSLETAMRKYRRGAGSGLGVIPANAFGMAAIERSGESIGKWRLSL